MGEGSLFLQKLKELHEYGIAKIFSPDDGRELGLQGMINHMIRETDFPTPKQFEQELPD